MASSLLFAPLFLVLPAPIKALIVVAGGFMFVGFEQQVEVQEAPQAIEAPAQPK